MKKFQSFFSSHLLLAVLIAVFLGIGYAKIVPIAGIRVFTTFNAIFASLLSFTVPLLILALVTTAIAETEKGAGKMLIFTIVLAYVSTILAGSFTYCISDWIFPNILSANDYANAVNPAHSDALKPFFIITFPPIMDVMSALLLSFFIGLAILKFDLPILKKASIELKQVIMLVITKVIIPLLPIYIFGVFAKMTAAGEMKLITHTYIKVIAVMLAILIFVLVVQYLIAGWVSKQNPFKMLHKMMPAILTALASSSSAATLPVTLRCAENLGARKNVIDFVIPMCANIHLSGAAIRTISLAIATMIMFAVPYTTPQIIGFIMLFSITVLAAPGIPGGVIMASVGMIQSMLGFNQEMAALIITLSIALDSIGTAVNVGGDGALMMIVNRITEEKETCIDHE